MTVERAVAPLASDANTRAQSETDRHRWVALIVLCSGFLMIILDQTIVNVALPSIQVDLHFSQSGLAWVVNAYLLSFGGLLLLLGRVGDLIGRRRIFLLGLGVFTCASLACGLAQTQAVLVAARFLQGIGGAMTAAVILGMIVTMFPEPAEQAKAIGVYSFIAAAGGAAGLLAGGVLTQTLSWHWIFFVNLPIGAATAFWARRVLPAEQGTGLGDGADVLGAALLVSCLMLLVYAIVGANQYSWGSSHTLVLGAVSLALMGAFFLRERLAAHPLVPLGVFRSRAVTGANVVQMLTVAGMFGMLFLGALYMQRVLRYSAVEVGLAFLPSALGIAAMSVGASARLVTRFGANRVLGPSLVLLLIGLLLFRRLPSHANYLADLFPAMAALGLGFGLAFPCLMTIAMSSASPTESGLVSGLVNTTQQVGGAIGLAVLATLSATQMRSARVAGHPLDAALISGYRLAFTVSVCLVAAAIVLVVVLLRPWARVRRTADAAAEAEASAESPVAPHAALCVSAIAFVIFDAWHPD